MAFRPVGSGSGSRPAVPVGARPVVGVAVSADRPKPSQSEVAVKRREDLKASVKPKKRKKMTAAERAAKRARAVQS